MEKRLTKDGGGYFPGPERLDKAVARREPWVVQIVPGPPGYRAVYAVPGDTVEARRVFSPIVLWAIVEEVEPWTTDGRSPTLDRTIKGYVAGEFVNPADEPDNFVGYSGPGDPEDDWDDEIDSFLHYRQRRLEGDEGPRGEEADGDVG